MIQRIQSVFLFAAFVLAGILFIVPFAEYPSTQLYSLSLTGLNSTGTLLNESFHQPVVLTITGVITCILIFFNIFLYTKRKFQMLLCWISVLLLLVLNGLMYFFTEKFKMLLDIEASYKIFFILPLVAAVLVVLAYFNIKKDERLVKSLDRLR